MRAIELDAIELRLINSQLAKVLYFVIHFKRILGRLLANYKRFIKKLIVLYFSNKVIKLYYACQYRHFVFGLYNCQKFPTAS